MRSQRAGHGAGTAGHASSIKPVSLEKIAAQYVNGDLR